MDKVIQLNSRLQEFKSSRDDRFVHCKVLVCHDQDNLNYSWFDSEVQMKCAEKSIRGIPLLANVYKDQEGNYKVGGHDVKVEISDTSEGFEIEEFYLEKPVGFIPEDTILSTVEINGKQYLSCTGVIWKTYSEQLLNILDDNNGQLDVSMEIAANDFDMREDGYIEIKDFTFLGITILGTECQPAMQGANISVFSTEIQNELAKMKKAYSEGGEKMEDNIIVQAEEDKEVCPECKEDPCVCDDKKEDEYEENHQEEQQEDNKYEELNKEYTQLKGDYEELKEKYDSLEEKLNSMSDYEELKLFKEQYDKAKFEQNIINICNKFGYESSDDKVVDKVNKALQGEFSLEAFEKEIALVYALENLDKKDNKKFAREEKEDFEIEVLNDSKANKTVSESLIEKYK